MTSTHDLITDLHLLMLLYLSLPDPRNCKCFLQPAGRHSQPGSHDLQ
jgi:hypothetical protein